MRKALAEADYHRLLNPEAVMATLGHGRPGAAALRAALSSHLPELAQTLSTLEDDFLLLCESADLPMPEVNATVEGLMVDALFRPQRVVVELDGAAAHGSGASVRTDRGRDLTLRNAGYTVLRYSWVQVTKGRSGVAADLRRALWPSSP